MHSAYVRYGRVLNYEVSSIVSSHFVLRHCFLLRLHSLMHAYHVCMSDVDACSRPTMLPNSHTCLLTKHTILLNLQLYLPKKNNWYPSSLSPIPRLHEG